MAIAAVAAAGPVRPADDAVIVERLPATAAPNARRQRAWRARLEHEPDRVELAVAAAREYLQAARASADARYEGYAQAALAPWWHADQAPVEVLVLRAALRERRHDFAGALADLDRVLEREPGHGQAWLSRASILQVRGEYGASLEACRRLAAAAGRLVHAACSAGAAGLVAGGETALAELRAALQTPRRGPAPTRAWAEAVRADVAIAQGRNDEAEAAFRNGLRHDPDDGYLRAAYADFLIDRGRRAEALALVPRSDAPVELALRRARALSPATAQARDIRARLEEAFAAARRRGDAPHLRSEAYFRLFVTGQAVRALELARANLAVQREPFDLRLLLEAALAAERPEAARPAIGWLHEAGVEHVLLAGLVDRLQERTR